MARFQGLRKGAYRNLKGYPVSSPRLTPLYFKGICDIGEVVFIGISSSNVMVGECRISQKRSHGEMADEFRVRPNRDRLQFLLVRRGRCADRRGTKHRTRRAFIATRMAAGASDRREQRLLQIGPASEVSALRLRAAAHGKCP